jgi:hypothetical protein
MESIFCGSGMIMSCADAAPDIMLAMTIAKADFHIHAPFLSAIGNLDISRGDAGRQDVIALCDGSLFAAALFSTSFPRH